MTKPVTREQWTAALRSGDFKQANGTLYSTCEDGFCCMGVLGKLAGGQTKEDQDGLLFGLNFRYASVSREICKMVGISSATQDQLMGLNDRGDSFETIANLIDGLPFEDRW